MDVTEYRTVDKSTWTRGPWDHEPDKAQWTDDATRLPCLIVRGPHGALCGYVGVSPDHPWFGKGYDDEAADVHGGLTFSGSCQEGGDPSRGICHIPAEGQPDNVWWLGFDCAHYRDLIPLYRSNGGTYRDRAYVENECRNLACQAKAVEGGWS